MTDAGLDALLSHTGRVMAGGQGEPRDADLRVGVDLGTAYTVVLATDGTGWPLAGAYEFAQVVRDGVVVDFHGAIRLVKRLKAETEQRLGRPVRHAASGFPPGVRRAEVRAVEHVLEGADIACTDLVDEPTAANTVLGVRDGAVVDVGGGTTGIAVFAGGQVVAVADEPTGGTHVSLVIAGALRIGFDEAEQRKRDPRQAGELFGLVRPVFEKIGTIVAGAIAGHDVAQLHLVGGTCRFPRIAEVLTDVTGVPASVPGDPLFVTALGLAGNDTGAS
jgi:ethanolamine utilization protein EutJ